MWFLKKLRKQIKGFLASDWSARREEMSGEVESANLYIQAGNVYFVTTCAFGYWKPLRKRDLRIPWAVMQRVGLRRHNLQFKSKPILMSVVRALYFFSHFYWSARNSDIVVGWALRGRFVAQSRPRVTHQMGREDSMLMPHDILRRGKFLSQRPYVSIELDSRFRNVQICTDKFLCPT